MVRLQERNSLPRSEIAVIRRERAQPRIGDVHYLHLKELHAGIAAALLEAREVPGPALDLYCGTQPYRQLFGERPTWGVDIDFLYASADLIGDLPLPFADETFSVVLCSQALYYRVDDHAVIAEIRRVLVPHGRAVVTVPFLFMKSKTGTQRRYSSRDLMSRFSGWESVDLRTAGSIGTGIAYVLGRLLQVMRRRIPGAAYVTAAAAVVVNILGLIIDSVIKPWTGRPPAVLIVVARR